MECGADPSTDELLPDLMPFQKQVRMRTLVLDLDGVLVQSVWQRKHGWKTVKRPGVEPFLETMAQYYELVVFSDRAHSYADPILNRVDPGIQTNQGPMLMYRLYKNSTQWRVCLQPRRCCVPCVARMPSACSIGYAACTCLQEPVSTEFPRCLWCLGACINDATRFGNYSEARLEDWPCTAQK